MRRALGFCVLTVAAMSLVSCAPHASTEAPPAANQAASGSNEAATKPAEQAVFKGTDISVYPGSGSLASSEGETLDWSAPDSPATVVTFYRSELGKKGWQINEEWTKKVLSPAEPPEHIRLIAIKGNSVAAVDISPDPVSTGKTAVRGYAMDRDEFLKSNPALSP